MTTPQTNIPETRLIGSTDDGHTFHTTYPGCTIITELSACGSHKRCSCGFWMTTNSCVHIVAAEQYLAECMTIEEMEEEEEIPTCPISGCGLPIEEITIEAGMGLGTRFWCSEHEDVTKVLEAEAMQ